MASTPEPSLGVRCATRESRLLPWPREATAHGALTLRRVAGVVNGQEREAQNHGETQLGAISCLWHDLLGRATPSQMRDVDDNAVGITEFHLVKRRWGVFLRTPHEVLAT